MVRPDLSSLSVSLHQGASLREHIDELATLRIRVFREYPYLYDGDLEYEARYLETYARHEAALIVLAHADGAIVGASSCVPLRDERAETLAAFADGTWPVDQTLYLGESVVLREYRGVGLGVRFFEEREAHALQLGLRRAVFCTVKREENDPRRPPHFQPLDGFWRRRGYHPLPERVACFSWREVGDAEESTHAMPFWGRVLE